MKRIIFSLFLFFLISNSVFSQCGTCAIPDCNNMIRKTGATADVTLKSALNYTSALAAPTEAYLLDPTGDPLLGKNGPFTFSACYEIYVTSASQTVGIAIKPIFTTGAANLSFTGELRKSGDCAASPIVYNSKCFFWWAKYPFNIRMDWFIHWDLCLLHNHQCSDWN